MIALPDNLDGLHLLLLIVVAYSFWRYQKQSEMYSRLWNEHKRLKMGVMIAVAAQVFSHFAKHFNDEPKKR